MDLLAKRSPSRSYVSPPPRCLGGRASIKWPSPHLLASALEAQGGAPHSALPLLNPRLPIPHICGSIKASYSMIVRPYTLTHELSRILYISCFAHTHTHTHNHPGHRPCRVSTFLRKASSQNRENQMVKYPKPLGPVIACLALQGNDHNHYHTHIILETPSMVRYGTAHHHNPANTTLRSSKTNDMSPRSTQGCVGT